MILHFSLHRQFSKTPRRRQIHETIQSYDPLLVLEKLGLEEVFVDATAVVEREMSGMPDDAVVPIEGHVAGDLDRASRLERCVI